MTSGNEVPLRAQHGVDPGVGRGDDQHTKALERPAVDKAPLLAGVVIAEEFAPNTRFADKTIAPDVHGAEILLECEVVTCGGVLKREQAISNYADR